MRLPKLGRVLSAHGELQPLVAKTRELRTLGGLIEVFLPPDLARKARVANYRDGELVVVAANSAVAAKLRLLAPSLSRFLSERRWQVNSVSVRVQPNASAIRDVAPRQNVNLSPESLRSLRALHESLADSPAREALGRLLERRGGASPAPRKGRS